MDMLMWRVQHVWYVIHGAKLWPVYTIGLVVGVPLIIKFHARIVYVLGRLLETAVYSCILHTIIWFFASIFNWLRKATSDPLLPSAGMKKDISVNLFSFKPECYSPKGLLWFEWAAIIVIAFFVFKYRYTYKKGSGG